MSWFRLAPWTRAPWRLWRSASLAVSVLFASTLLGVSVCSGPLVSSAAATAALRQDLDDGCQFSVGLRVEGYVPVGPETPANLAKVSTDLDSSISGEAGLLPSVTTLFGGIADVRFGDKATFAQIVSRTGADQWISVVDQVDGDGIWLADTTAKESGATAGSTVDVQINGQLAVPMRVKGIFGDLAKQKRPKFWCSMSKSFEAVSNEDRPAVALLGPGAISALLVRESAARPVWWEVSPKRDSWTESSAISAYRPLAALEEANARGQGPIAQVPGSLSGRSLDQQGSLAHARRAKAGSLGVLLPVSLGAGLVSILLLMLAVEAWRSRRQHVLVLLAQRGFGPAPLGALAVAEFSTPVIVGLASRWFLALKTVPLVGPSGVVESAVARSTALLTAASALVVLAGLFAALYFELRHEIAATSGQKRRRLPWEQVCLATAGAAAYEMRSRASGVVGGQVDSLVTAFPILLLAGASGVLTRVAVGMISRMQKRVVARRRGAWLRLASGRLTSNRSRTIPTVTALAVSSGVVLFAASLASTVNVSATAKSTMGLGAAQVAVLDTNDELVRVQQAAIKDGTVALRASEPTVLVTEKPPVDILGIDPATFASGAYWQSEFSGTPLRTLLQRLASASTADSLAAIAVGPGLPDAFALEISTTNGSRRVNVKVVERATSFPGLGLNSTRPLVVLPLNALVGFGAEGRPEVWSDARGVDLDGMVRATGVIPQRIIQASTKRNVDVSHQVAALRSARAVGGCAVAASLSAVWLYFAGFGDQRRRDRAIARMLGLSRRGDLAANIAEVVPLIASGVVLAASLSWLALRLTLKTLDPNVSTPPAPLFRFAYVTAGIFALVTVLSALVLAVMLARATVRTDIRGALRDAD
jgi:putative ABC transport system permease protein